MDDTLSGLNFLLLPFYFLLEILSIDSLDRFIRTHDWNFELDLAILRRETE